MSNGHNNSLNAQTQGSNKMTNATNNNEVFGTTTAKCEVSVDGVYSGTPITVQATLLKSTGIAGLLVKFTSFSQDGYVVPVCDLYNTGAGQLELASHVTLEKESHKQLITWFEQVRSQQPFMSI